MSHYSEAYEEISRVSAKEHKNMELRRKHGNSIVHSPCYEEAGTYYEGRKTDTLTTRSGGYIDE